MFGVLTIAVRTFHDRWGYGVYSGPIGTAILIIAMKWVSTVGISADRAQGICSSPLTLVLLYGGPIPPTLICRQTNLRIEPKLLESLEMVIHA